MVESTMSPADVVALSGNDGFGGNGSWFIWIILIFAIFGGGLWGNGTQYATSAEVQNGFNNQNNMSQFETLKASQSAYAMDNANLINDVKYSNLQNTYAMTSSINSGFNDISSQLCCGFNGIDKSIMQSTYATTTAMNAGFDGVQKSLCDISHQISDGVCALKTQMLQDKYDAAQNQLNLAQIASANSVQTQNILNAIGSYYTNPPAVPYPYYLYGTAVATGTTVG